MQSMHLSSGAGDTNYLLVLQQHTHRLPSMTTVLGTVHGEVKKKRYQINEIVMTQIPCVGCNYLSLCLT